MGLLDAIARSLAHISDASRVVHTFHVEPDTDEFSSDFQARNAMRARGRRRRYANHHRQQHEYDEIMEHEDDDDVPFEPTIVVRYTDTAPIVGNVGDQEYVQSRTGENPVNETAPSLSPRRANVASSSPISEAKFLRAATRNAEGKSVRMVGDRAEWETEITRLQKEADSRRKEAARRRRRGEEEPSDDFAPYSHMAHYSGPDSDGDGSDRGRSPRRRGGSSRPATMLAPSLVARRFTHRHACVGTETDDREALKTAPIVVVTGRSWTLFITISTLAFIFTFALICYLAFGRHYLADPTKVSGCDPNHITELRYQQPSTTEEDSTNTSVDPSTIQIVYRCGPMGLLRMFYPGAGDAEQVRKSDPLYGYHSNYMPDNAFVFSNKSTLSVDQSSRYMRRKSEEAQVPALANWDYDVFMISLSLADTAAALTAAGNNFTANLTAPSSDYPSASKTATTRDVTGLFTVIDLEIAGLLTVACLSGGLTFLLLLSINIVCCVNGCRRNRYVARLDEQYAEAARQRRTGEIYKGVYGKNLSNGGGVLSRGRSFLSGLRNNNNETNQRPASDIEAEEQRQWEEQQRRFPRVKILYDKDDDPYDQTHHVTDPGHNIPNKIERRFGSVLTPLFLIPASHSSAITADIDKEDKRVRGMRRVILYFMYLIFGLVPGACIVGMGFDVCDRYASSIVLLSITLDGRPPSYVYVACLVVLVALLVPPYLWYLKHALQYVMARYH